MPIIQNINSLINESVYGYKFKDHTIIEEGILDNILNTFNQVMTKFTSSSVEPEPEWNYMIIRDELIDAKKNLIDNLSGIKLSVEDFMNSINRSVTDVLDTNDNASSFTRSIMAREIEDVFGVVKSQASQVYSGVSSYVQKWIQSSNSEQKEMAKETLIEIGDSIKGAFGSLIGVFTSEFRDQWSLMERQALMKKVLDAAPEEYRRYIIDFYRYYGDNPVIKYLMDASNKDPRVFIGLLAGSAVALVGGFAGATYYAVKKIKNSRDLNNQLVQAIRELESASTTSAKDQARLKVVALGSKSLALTKLESAV